jgi:chemotaxis protein MotB
MASKSSSDRSFEAIRFHASIGLFLFSLIFLLISIWLVHRHAEERDRLRQVIGDNRQLLENQRLLQGAVDQLANNLARQTDRLKTKSQALASSEQARLELEKERLARLTRAQRQAERVETLRQALAPALEPTDAQVFLEKDNVTIRLPGEVMFETGEAFLQPIGQDILLFVAEILRNQLTRFPVRIEGHTDNIPIGDNLKLQFPTNWHLSSARASTAAGFLVEEGLIRPDRLEAVGMGSANPVADNTTPEGRAQNRRLDLVINIAEAETP